MSGFIDSEDDCESYNDFVEQSGLCVDNATVEQMSSFLNLCQQHYYLVPDPETSAAFEYGNCECLCRKFPEAVEGVLERSYCDCSYPCMQEKVRLSSACNISLYHVDVWFNNHRIHNSLMWFKTIKPFSTQT
ncbi:hypothetical protein DSO57_1026695 [Entomophthora muscae]|uniref:Uncharacterized protein n=1 Tax=Entomophthora muscae TaxID=34485 RepID=A0ACC2U0D8_9FUNG|nr:hypothetical protein DSO57_1026695 [Entomophthora muscae]